jgi:curved DNA-binding protein CbpA
MDKIEQAYRLLGIHAGVSISEVTRAYRLLAKKYHPDSNPGSADTMIRINNAYQTIKEHLARGEKDSYIHPWERNVNEMERRFRSQQEAHRREEELRRRAQREEARRREEELRRRAQQEQEAWAKWWEKRLEERRREDEDLKSYNLVVKHLFSAMAEFYEQRLHYPHVRSRPMGSIGYETFLRKHSVLVEKCGKLSRSGLSKQYREKFGLLLQFLELFLQYLVDAPDEHEKNSSALLRFGEVADARDRFLSSFFSAYPYDRESALASLKSILGSFEEFIRQYPSSPLVCTADLSVDLLWRLYHTFLRE